MPQSSYYMYIHLEAIVVKLATRLADNPGEWRRRYNLAFSDRPDRNTRSFT